MDLTNIFLIASAIVLIVVAVVEVLKKTFKIKKRFLPATSVLVGIFIALILTPLTDHNFYYMGIVGLITGLTASGAFDLVKALKESGKK